MPNADAIATTAGATLSVERSKTKPTALEKSKAAQWTFTKAVHDSLNPFVRDQEAEDYERYIRHPQNLPLVVSTDAPIDIDSSEYQEYVDGKSENRDVLIVAHGHFNRVLICRWLTFPLVLGEHNGRVVRNLNAY